MVDEHGGNNGALVVPPAPAVGQLVTLEQIRGLLTPFGQQLDTIQDQVTTLQKKKPDNLVDPAP